jgi:acetyl-CoA carboxylase biotin carboxyl carrier protein
MKENDPVATLEAMKIEMPVAAPAAGVVKEINLKSGDEVTSDTILMTRE